jgi:thioredoxin reductase (NADPH)
MIDVAVIGAGPAGNTAALYAARAGRQVAIIRGHQPGGQLTTTSEIENWPGEALIGGAELMERLMAQVAALGVATIDDAVTGAASDDHHRLALASGDTLAARTVIVATGARARWLGLAREAELLTRGLSACAICDGYFSRGADVAVIGGGNTAVEEALFLARLARQVTIVHRGSAFRAERILQDRLARCDNVAVRWQTTVDGFLGEDRLEGLMLRQSDVLSTLPVAGAFIAIGHDPATEAFRGWLDLDDGGYIVTAPGSTRTRRSGVFAAGDVVDRVYRQAVTSAGTGCMAALDADRFLG